MIKEKLMLNNWNQFKIKMNVNFKRNMNKYNKNLTEIKKVNFKIS